MIKNPTCISHSDPQEVNPVQEVFAGDGRCITDYEYSFNYPYDSNSDEYSHYYLESSNFKYDPKYCPSRCPPQYTYTYSGGNSFINAAEDQVIIIGTDATPSTCTETAETSDPEDANACASVTGDALNDAAECESIMTNDDNTIRACTYEGITEICLDKNRNTDSCIPTLGNPEWVIGGSCPDISATYNDIDGGSGSGNGFNESDRKTRCEGGVHTATGISTGCTYIPMWHKNGSDTRLSNHQMAHIISDNIGENPSSLGLGYMDGGYI